MKPITEEWLDRANEDLDVALERYPSDLGLLPSGKPSIQDAKELYNFADALYHKVKKLLE